MEHKNSDSYRLAIDSSVGGHALEPTWIGSLGFFHYPVGNDLLFTVRSKGGGNKPVITQIIRSF